MYCLYPLSAFKFWWQEKCVCASSWTISNSKDQIRWCKHQLCLQVC
jgi:hypothetical protein